MSKKNKTFFIFGVIGIVVLVISSFSLTTKSAFAKVCGVGGNNINYSLCPKNKTLEECMKPKVLPEKNPVFDNVERVIIAVDNYSNNEKSQAMLPDILKHEALETLLKEKYEKRYEELGEGTEPSDYKRCYNRHGQSVTVYPYESKKKNFTKNLKKQVLWPYSQSLTSGR
jgi:hypothetical protein